MTSLNNVTCYVCAHVYSTDKIECVSECTQCGSLNLLIELKTDIKAVIEIHSEYPSL